MLVPELIGEGHDFENLQGWIQYANSIIKNKFNEVEMKLRNVITEEKKDVLRNTEANL